LSGFHAFHGNVGKDQPIFINQPSSLKR